MEDFHFRGDSIAISRDKWMKLKEMCQVMHTSAEQIRQQSPELATLFLEKSSSMLQLLSSEPSGSNFSHKRVPAPLQRPRISKKKKISEDDASPSSHSASSEDEKKAKNSRRQRAKAAPSEQLYCRSCGETNTCEWRRGPDGYKSLCNACGIHYAKLVKREESAAASYKPKPLNLNMLLNTTTESTSNPSFSIPTAFVVRTAS